jgi:hypothetical protein
VLRPVPLLGIGATLDVCHLLAYHPVSNPTCAKDPALSPTLREVGRRTMKNPYREFVLRYLARGAIGVSVGLAAVTSAAARHEPKPAEQTATKSFSQRLEMLWRAIPETDTIPDAAESQHFAQGVIRPFPNLSRPPHGKTHTKTFPNISPPHPPHGKTHTKTFNKLP